jgi:carbonic anhydrase
MAIRFTIVVLLILAAGLFASHAGAQSFGYLGGNGPAHWGELRTEWKTCSTGKNQSPVDFEIVRSRQRLSIDYTKSSGEIINNGHTIEVKTEGRNILKLKDTVYELEQFHFHTASEHTVKGRGFDMEMHLVHKSEEGRIAVIGVFLKRGRNSGALSRIFENLPNDVNVSHRLEKPFHPAELLPSSRTHYAYVGSLTTPPCTEGVQWIVMTEPMTVSDEDMAQFADRIKFNARMVQRKQKR